MDSLTITPNLTMLRVNGWQLYAWSDGDSVTLIDTGEPGSGAEILSAVPRVDRIVLTHGHVDHIGSAAELRESTGAAVMAGAGDAAVIRGGARVLAIPGHTEGSIAVHLPEHGVLFTGDTVANVGSVMLGTFNQDRARTVASFRRLAALDVQTACFGHGEPIASDAGDRLRDVVHRAHDVDHG